MDNYLPSYNNNVMQLLLHLIINNNDGVVLVVTTVTPLVELAVQQVLPEHRHQNHKWLTILISNLSDMVYICLCIHKLVYYIE